MGERFQRPPALRLTDRRVISVIICRVIFMRKPACWLVMILLVVPAGALPFRAPAATSAPLDSGSAVSAEAIASPGAVVSRPKLNFWQEFDIVFWQTVPFVAFWSYVVATQLSGGGAIIWDPVLNTTLVVSAANAAVHARQALSQQN